MATPRVLLAQSFKSITVSWVGMKVVGREHAGHSQEGLATQRDMPEHAGHSQEGLATQRDMPEHFLCARWEHC